MGVGRIQDGNEIIGRLHMTDRDQIIGATGSIRILALLKDTLIHTLINGEGTNTKIITGG